MDISKKLARSVAVLGLASLLAAPIFAQAEETSMNANAEVNASTNTAVGGSMEMKGLKEKQKEERAALQQKMKDERDALKAKMAQQKEEKRKASASCIKPAIETRDNAVIAAWDGLGASVKTALTTRKTALLAAWDVADDKGRRDALRAAWKAWRDAARTARATFRDARRAAWTKFGTDRHACGSDASGQDLTNVSVDATL